MGHSEFRQIWAVDFEFLAPPGERPTPLCLVARELRSGRLIRLWLEGNEPSPAPPYNIGDDALFVAFFASAEIGCHYALGWPPPRNVLDLYVEFKNLTNGLQVAGRGLLNALAYFGIDAIDAAEKESMRALALRGGPYTHDEKVALLDYCQTDVDAVQKLLAKMEAIVDFPRALLRGGFMAAAAHMEHWGVPIDVRALTILRERWTSIQDELVARLDAGYGVFEGRSFRYDLFEQYVARHRLPWPRLESGRLDLQDDTFRAMAKSHPSVSPLRELRHALSQLRLADLTGRT